VPVEAPGPQQGRIEDLRPIGRRKQHDSARRVEPVEFRQQLVQGLLALVMTADAGECAPRTTEGIELVDEDDRGRLRTRLLEQIPHPRGTDADEHLDELGAADGEERYAGLPGHRPRQQRLAGTRRADQQHALRDSCAQPTVCLRILQEPHDLLEFFLRLVDARDIVEGDAGVLLDVNLGVTLAHR